MRWNLRKIFKRKKAKKCKTCQGKGMVYRAYIDIEGDWFTSGEKVPCPDCGKFVED
jgi:DnaJ-class molecular chaperone